jgi:hypothetical protein
MRHAALYVMAFGRMRLANSGPRHGRQSGGVPQEELQEDLQRFAGQLIERTGQAATEVMRAAEQDTTSTEALRRAITYESAALDIATEPLPEVAVLDMLVFVRLSRHALAQHWIPKVFGERGRPFVLAFEQAEKQLWPIASKILDRSQREAWVRRIDDWTSKNPDLVLLEFVRLTDFSARAGSASVAIAEEIGGLLSSVKSATQAADEAVLLAERARFLAGRLPFVIRHQARLGGREVVGDSLALVGSTQALIESVKDLQPIVTELLALEARGTEAAHEIRLLLNDLKILVPSAEQVVRFEHVLDAANGLIKRAGALIEDIRVTIKVYPESPIARVVRLVGQTVVRALAYLITGDRRSRYAPRETPVHT